MPTHIYFAEEEEEVGAPSSSRAAAVAAPAPAPAVVGAAVPTATAAAAAAVGPQFARCCSSARVDYNYEDPCYVFKVVRSLDGSRLAATLSNNAIKTYSIHGDAITHAGDIQAHTKKVTDAVFPLADAPHALYSCSADGTVRGFDARSAHEVERCATLPLFAAVAAAAFAFCSPLLLLSAPSICQSTPQAITGLYS